jgi:beta-xylosidase
MKLIIRYILLFAIVQTVIPFHASVAQQHINAVISGDFADPSILRKGNQYYAVGTSSEWAPQFPVYTSSNLKEWKQAGYIFDKAPEWTSGSFWAPEYYFHNDTYFIYYTARRRKDNVSCIGVATSKFPDKGFKDHGVLIEQGKEAIDAFIFNDNGQLYITYKAFGLDGRPIEILGRKLSSDGLKLEGNLFSLFKDTKGIGLEGQSIIKKDDYYYLFYSAGNCCGSKCDYNVRVARSKTLTGDYEEYSQNPVLMENADWKCSGHGTFVNAPEGRTYYLYHAYNKKTTVYTGREGLLSELIWPNKNDWPAFKAQRSTVAKMKQIDDSFNAKTIEKYWQWDFRNSTPVFNQLNGNLFLSGKIKDGNKAGVILAVRPLSTSFEATTTVVNNNDALKGLVFYGDAHAAVGIGTKAKKVEFWKIQDSIRTILAEADLFSNAAVQLRFVFNSNCIARCISGRVLGHGKK